MESREEAFEEKRKICEEIFNEYSSQMEELIQQASGQVVREEFASGGDIRRGYYCPNPVLEIVKYHRV